MFGDDDDGVSGMGSVDIDDQMGEIVACHPGESLAQAQTRRRANDDSSSSSSTVRNLGAGSILSPGMIDVHTHVSQLGRDWEGYQTATLAASAGGITTIVGMPLNSLPPTTTLEALELEREAIAGTNSALYVDVGLWGGVVPDNLDTFEALLESPHVLGLKAFLAPLPPSAGYQAVSPKQLLQVARRCAAIGTDKPILVHSELMTQAECDENTKAAFANRSARSYAAHLESRPPQWEQEAVRVVCQAAEHCRMHVVHLSDARGCLPLIEQLKATYNKGGDNNHLTQRLTVETCPHYLMLDNTMIEDGDTRVKCFPPIRDVENRDLLWRGLKKGLVDMIASDHSPCEPSMRLIETGDFQSAWGGLSGLQYQLQATWTEAFARGCTPWQMAQWWSTKPAQLAGLARKGRIAPGFQADLCWWDPDFVGAPNSYSEEHHRWKGTTFFAENTTMRGRVLGTWVRGKLVYDGLRDAHKEPIGMLLEHRQRTTEPN